MSGLFFMKNDCTMSSEQASLVILMAVFTEVSAVTSQLEGPGFDSKVGRSVWSLFSLCGFYSSKTWTPGGLETLLIVMCVNVFVCLSCDGQVTHPGC